MDAEGADAVAGAEEREVPGDHLVEEGAELRLHPVLHRRLLLGRVGGVERAAADEDARQRVEVEPGHGRRLEPYPDEVALVESAGAEEERVLLVGGLVLGARGEEDEWLHGSTIFLRSRDALRALDRRF